MKRKIDFLIVALFAVVLFASCERVAPNYAGVLMENYGKQGKEDFKIVAGKVSTWELGTELFQVPLFDQRGEFSDPVTLKAADNTEFTARPTYSYKVMKNRAIDIVFDNKHIDKADTPSGKDGFMQSLEDNILEPRIYDLIKEESRKHINNQLLPVWLDRLSGNYHASPFFFSLQVESSTLHTLHDGRYYKESFCSCKMPLL